MRTRAKTAGDGEWQKAGAARRSRAATCVPLGLGFLLLTFSVSCRLIQTTAELPGRAVGTVTQVKPDKHTVDPVELQQTLLRFADEFSARTIVSVEDLRQATNAMDRAESLRWKIGLSTAISSIATGPNAFANVLDMTAFVTVTRMALENYWQPKVFGASALPLLEGCRMAETNIWQLTSTFLKPKQQAELRNAVEAWYRQNPHRESSIAARAVGFASQVVKAKSTTTEQPGSVFSLLNLDPLSGLDPATREIAQTRLLAERALYLSHLMPTLLRWQTELLALNTAQLPVVQQLVTNSTQIATSVERFAAVSEKLPGQLSDEREQILQTLQSQEKELAGLAGEVRQTLLAGSQMSTSFNTTLTTLDGVMQHFGIGETNSARTPDTNAEPFRIQDYQDTAAQLETTARQLTELLVTLDQTIGSTNLAQLSAQVGPVVQQAQTGGQKIVNYAFWKAVCLLGLVLLAVLIYRFVATRMFPPRSTSAPK